MIIDKETAVTLFALGFYYALFIYLFIFNFFNFISFGVS